MLIGAEPRGMPGTTVDCVEFQRAAEGHPLDDIIVHAHDRQGNNAVLEIQVKRTVTFAPSDREFKKVVTQIAETTRDGRGLTNRHELAVAVAQGSKKIDGPYQDVLTWARRLGCHDTFFRRIDGVGLANDNMRTFVQTFRNNLRGAGLADDDETAWLLLSRFQILPFDYTAPGSAFDSWDSERAYRALHSDESHRAGDFWKRLIELAMDTASSGGALNLLRLREVLEQGSFRLAGSHQFSTVRDALAEAARHALDDIHDQVGNVSLLRSGWLDAVRSGLTQGRYLEIRGDAGVGKSALLKHFAQQLADEAPIIVLSPKRATGGGWIAMRSVLGFDGSARSLLVDLASSGGMTLFLDGLDFFNDNELLTVRDLVSEASKVPGINVIATARSDFGSEDPNWVPAAAVERLGQADPITVGELCTSEISELRAIAPELDSLLAEAHPARAVTRNLFRLSRLANRPGAAQVLRTEIDMAEQWWKSADGASATLQRDRVRVLRDLSEQTLDHREPLDTKSHPARAVDGLVQSQTLRELDGDRVTFYHDVLRDWAVGSLLYFHRETRDRLPLDQPAPARLIRGVELAARMALERHQDDSRWREWIDRVSRGEAHGSWRRAVLLASVRSEIHYELLERVSDFLLENQARVLRELARTVMAIDGRAATEFGAFEGAQGEQLYVPNGSSWVHLIRWLLSVGEHLPSTAIPDVAGLYAGWCALGVGMLKKIRMPLWLYSRRGRVSPSDALKQYEGLFVSDGNRICNRILIVIRGWLAEIEDSRYPRSLRQLREPFNGELSSDQVHLLEITLRDSFLTTCHIKPSLASDYIKSLLARGREAHSVKLNVIRFPHSLSHAAPDELAQLAIAALMPDEEDETERWLPHPPFLSVMHHYSPPSPDHGPFIDLLAHAPKAGISLVRQIVDYATSHYKKGTTGGDNVVRLPFADGDHAFPWPKTYPWARASQSQDFCVTSALMALSKWAKQQIQSGDSVGAVLNDIFSLSNSPSAYLLVGVDLLLDAWPASRESAIPFLACPELLCLDRSLVWSEYAAERLPDRMVENPHPRAGSVRSLIDLLEYYAVSGSPELRERLVSLLSTALERLGPYREESSLNDPDFMVFHALNRLDPRNWRQATANPANGTVSMKYVAPEAEARHLAHLEDQSRPEIDDATLRAAIMVAVEDATQSSPDLATAAVRWAQQVSDDSPDHRWAVTASALLLVRDADDVLRAQNQEWAWLVFADAARKELNPLYEPAHTLIMNPAAIALVGITQLLKDNATPEGIRYLLDLAARKDCAGAPGFAAAATILDGIDDRLPRAVLRTAVASCIRPRDADLFVSEDRRNALIETHRQRIESVVEAELVWLNGDRTEPEWPPFTRQEPRINRGIPLSRDTHSNAQQSLNKTPPDEYVDHQSAARWLNSAHSLFSIAERPWLRHMADAYASWTAVANGSGLCKHDDVDATPLGEWNDSYFRLQAYCLPRMRSSEVDEFALAPLTELPDSAFVSITEQFLRHVDNLYFNEILPVLQAVHIRSVLIDRLIESGDWEHRPDEWQATEVNLGRLAARMFLHDGWSRPPRCYVHSDRVDLVDPLLPALQRLAESGPCFFVALNLIEVDPRPNHLGFILAAAEAWLMAYPDNSNLWRDQLIGRRICGLIETILDHQPSALSRDEVLRQRIYGLLVSLTSLGVSEAAALERTLSKENL